MRIFIFLLVLVQQVYGQSKIGSVQTFNIPAIQSVFFDMEILDSNYTLVPVNGGLFCPEKQSWYKTPDERLFNSVSYFQPSNTMNYSVLNNKSSFIIRTSTDNSGKAVKDSFRTAKTGVFFCKQLDADTLIYGGMTDGRFTLYTYSGKKSAKLFNFNNRITGIQFINSHSFYFQVKNNIYFFSKGYAPKIIFASEHIIYGFCFDSRGNLYISRKEGIFKYMGNSVSLILPFVTGFLKLTGNKLYILSFQDNVMTKLNI